MDMPIATLTQKMSHERMPLFIGHFLPEYATPTPELIRVENWQAFIARFSGGNGQDLLKSELQQLPLMVSVEESGQRIHEVLNPYTLFIRHAILLWQNPSLRLTHTEDELLEMAAGLDSALPSSLADQAEVLSQAGNRFLISYYALHHYFAQGGGPCYLLPVESDDQPDTPAIRQKIASAPENLLICSLLDHAHDASLRALLPEQTPFFSLTDAAGWISSDCQITLFDPQDEQQVFLFILNPGGNDPVPLTLAELRAGNPALAEQICEQLAPVSLPVVLPAAIANISMMCTSYQRDKPAICSEESSSAPAAPCSVPA